MSSLSKGNESNITKKIELMIKVITRTDTYLNSANTKSTILLSLASALIVALIVNFKYVTALVNEGSDRSFVSFLLLLVIILLIASIVFSLRGISPYLMPSVQKNTFSFVDIIKGYESLAHYKKSFTTTSERDFLNQLISLNYNLSKALIGKYERQIWAITFIEAAAYVSGFSIYIIILANN